VDWSGLAIGAEDIDAVTGATPCEPLTKDFLAVAQLLTFTAFDLHTATTNRLAEAQRAILGVSTR
jgi:hypothetical protein